VWSFGQTARAALLEKGHQFMRHLGKSVLDFLHEEDGPTAVEYAVMLALIIVVCLAAILIIGQKTNDNFNVIPLGSAMDSGT
jgi:pilus assembly protein Flp/PilA